MNRCLDDWILGRYWTQSVTERLRDHPDALSKRLKAIESALGEESAADFYFEVECAEAFCELHDVPFYLHVGYNILVNGPPRNPPSVCPFDPDRDAYPRFKTKDRQVTNERDSHAKCMAIHEHLYPDEGGYGPEWVPPKTKAEGFVESCDHRNLGQPIELEFRRGLYRLSVLGFLGGAAPVCNDCNGRILCACIKDDVHRHFGATHAVLASYVYEPFTHSFTHMRNALQVGGTQECLTRCGRGCLGFKPGLCDLCRIDRPAIPVDTGFRNIYALMYAIRMCLREEPDIYHALFDGQREIDAAKRKEELAEAFIQIVRGRPTRELRIAHHVEPPEVPPEEAFRPYLNKARNLFRAAYGLPGINEGWVSETKLLRIVEELFPSEQILDHYSPRWLQGLELDIYLPNQSLAFEYMGIQHYQPVERFGGAEGYAALIQRDRLKRELCEKRGVELIYVRHDEPLTIEAIREKCRSR